jgi:hypothetical protein
MAVNISTDTPKGLLAKFNAAIGQHEPKGKIDTWMLSDDGKYYTHTAERWTKKAWFMPSTSVGLLTFNIIKPKDRNVTSSVYAYYHGHLIETFLNHFDTDFSSAAATGLPAAGDHCSS